MVNNFKPVFPIYQILDFIFELDVSSSEKLLLLALLHFYNSKTKACFPGIRALAASTGMVYQTILNATDKLVEKGLITLVKGDQTKSNRYNLLFIGCYEIGTPTIKKSEKTPF